MAGGLFALLDDVAVIARKAAVVMDDVAAGAAKASVKSAALVVDDTAVTPQYVANIAPARELGIVKRIARGSILNKLLIIIPLALILSQFAQWALPFLLIVGGSYLCFEGAEKVMNWLGLHVHEEHHSTVAADVSDEINPEDPEASENKLVSGAVRTDLVLSAEIMLIALTNIDTDAFITRLLTLIVVAVGMTVVVYGSVGLIIRMDDAGLSLMQKSNAAAKKLGRGLVAGMPKVLTTLTIVGTLAMLWVGGHLVVENLHQLHFDLPYEIIHGATDMVKSAGGFVYWLADTVLAGLAGLMVGLLIVGVTVLLAKVRGKAH